MVKSMKYKKDHQERRNFDDFNEFFWSPNCLKCHYSSSSLAPNDDIEHNLRGCNIEMSTALAQNIAEGLATAPKNV